MFTYLIGVKRGGPLAHFPSARFHARAGDLWLYLIESDLTIDQLRPMPGLYLVEGLN